jgi:ATP-dependent protease ClpP protease subunit
MSAGSSKAVVRIYGDIGQSWWDDDAVSAASFAKDLDEIGNVDEIEVHLNSPGGVAFDGVTIMNQLLDHPAKVTVYVDGLAASAASVVAMAGDDVVMGRGAQMMIHDASIFSWGDAATLRKDAARLDSLSNSMASVYAAKAGGTAESWREIMQAETWYTAEEAVEAGLADRLSAKDSDDAETAQAAAMLRTSAAARLFRYQGRAHAPAPQTPARPGGQQDNPQGGAVEIADEDFATLRTELGLDEDATIGDVLEAVKAKDAQETAKTTAKLPPGVTMIDEGTLTQLRSDAAKGVEAHKQQQKARREGLVAAALRDGKIRAVDKDRYLTNLELDPETYEGVLASLEPGLVPTSELGSDDGSVDEVESGNIDLAKVRERPHYAALRGIV